MVSKLNLARADDVIIGMKPVYIIQQSSEGRNVKMTVNLKNKVLNNSNIIYSIVLNIPRI